MNKVTYTKIKKFNIFSKTIFKTVESYIEYSEDNIEDDFSPILLITQDYYNQEFNIDKK